MIAQESVIDKALFRPREEHEPEWLYEQRAGAWELFVEAPLPDRVQHLYRYTDPKQFIPRELLQRVESALPEISVNGGHGTGEDELPLLPDEARRLGVKLLPLLQAANSDPELVRASLGSIIDARVGKFEAMNLALWETGLFLYVPANVTLADPIMLRSVAGAGVNISRLLIVVGDNAEVTIVDEYSGGGQDALIHSVVEGVVGQSSRVKLATMLDLETGSRLHLTHRNRLDADAVLHSASVALGGSVTKVNWSTQLAGRGANSDWRGVLLGTGKQHFDHFTGHHHTANETYSNLDLKVAVTDRSVSAYTGRINIDKDAFFCEAYQENRNLLLSESAKVESIPELEIVNDEVKCSHGVTVGALEEDQLFYLMSRGITRDEAMRIILSGFFEVSVESLPELLREPTRQKLLAKLEV